MPKYHNWRTMTSVELADVLLTNSPVGMILADRKAAAVTILGFAIEIDEEIEQGSYSDEELYERYGVTKNKINYLTVVAEKYGPSGLYRVTNVADRNMFIKTYMGYVGEPESVTDLNGEPIFGYAIDRQVVRATYYRDAVLVDWDKGTMDPQSEFVKDVMTGTDNNDPPSSNVESFQSSLDKMVNDVSDGLAAVANSARADAENYKKLQEKYDERIEKANTRFEETARSIRGNNTDSGDLSTAHMIIGVLAIGAVGYLAGHYWFGGGDESDTVIVDTNNVF